MVLWMFISLSTKQFHGVSVAYMWKYTLKLLNPKLRHCFQY